MRRDFLLAYELLENYDYDRLALLMRRNGCYLSREPASESYETQCFNWHAESEKNLVAGVIDAKIQEYGLDRFFYDIIDGIRGSHHCIYEWDEKAPLMQRVSQLCACTNMALIAARHYIRRWESYYYQSSDDYNSRTLP